MGQLQRALPECLMALNAVNPHPRLVGIKPDAKAEKLRKCRGELFGNNRNGNLDIRYSAYPYNRARHSEGEVVLSLKIRFCGI